MLIISFTPTSVMIQATVILYHLLIMIWVWEFVAFVANMCSTIVLIPALLALKLSMTS